MDVRHAAAEAIRRYGTAAHGAAPALIRALGHSDPDTRVAAMKALGQVGVIAADAVPALIDALGAPDARVRESAALFLGRLGAAAHDAVVPLNRALNDADGRVRLAAGDALLQILTPKQPQPPHSSGPGNPVLRVAYLAAPEQLTPRAKWWNEKAVIAATPSPPASSNFAAVPRPPVAEANVQHRTNLAAATLLPAEGSRQLRALIASGSLQR
jgi:HEAT repeat protein